jgi:hypothetical protein
LLATPKAPVKDPRLPRGFRVEGVAAVHEQFWFLHQLGYPVQVEGSDLLPLRGDYGRVRPGKRLVWVENDLELG